MVALGFFVLMVVTQFTLGVSMWKCAPVHTALMLLNQASVGVAAVSATTLPYEDEEINVDGVEFNSWLRTELSDLPRGYFSSDQTDVNPSLTEARSTVPAEGHNGMLRTDGSTSVPQADEPVRREALPGAYLSARKGAVVSPIGSASKASGVGSNTVLQASGRPNRSAAPAVVRNVPPTNAQFCVALAVKHREAVFMPPDFRDDYCMHKCQFIRHVQCETSTAADPLFSFSLKPLIDWFDAVDEDQFFETHDEPDIVTPEVMEVWIQMGWRTWWILLGVVPVLLNQAKVERGRIWYSSFFIVAFASIHALGFCSFGIAINNVYISWLSLVSPVNSQALPQYVIMTIGTLASVFSAFLVGPGVQISITLCMITGYAMYIKAAFFHPGKGSSFGGVGIVLVQMFILTEQLHLAYAEYGLRSYTAALLEYIIGSYLPYGRSSLFFRNSAYLSYRLVDKIGYTIFNLRPGCLILCAVVLQCLLLVFSRACIGAYYLYSLRCRFEFEALSLGLWTYMIDIGGPLRMLYRQFFMRDARDHRRLLYGMAGFSLTVCEMHFARELFVARVVFTVIDRVFVHSPYGRATHYLCTRTDLGGAYPHELFERALTHNLNSHGAYPHPNAGAWHDLEKVLKLGECVDVMSVVSDSGKKLRGMAMAVAGHTHTLLYSVAHVTRNASQIRFRDHALQDPQFEDVSDGDDPVTSTTCDIPNSGEELILLTDGEIDKITSLICLNRVPDELSSSKKVVVCYVNDWTVERGTGDLRVCANLRKGDSGGPLLAVLYDGGLRLAGVVSRGSERSPGNHVSLVTGKKTYDSDSDSAGSIRRFNSVRRHRGHMSSECADGVRYKAYEELVVMFKTYADELRGFQSWPAHYAFDDYPKFLGKWTYIVTEMAKRRGDIGTRRGQDEDEEPGDAEDAQPAGQRPNKGKRRKNIRKDRAAVKQAGFVGQVFREKLLRIYSARDAHAVFNELMKGNLTGLPSRGYISRVQEGMHMFEDDLPSDG